MSLTATEQLLIDLLKIPSESGQEKAIIDYLEQKLAGDFQIERIAVSVDRANLWCTTGQPEVVLAAHVDTVPGQLEVGYDEENIFGRGACDNKAAAAAMITAARQALDQGQTNFGLLFTIGEETNFDGALAVQKFLQEKNLQPTKIIIGEPTELLPITAQRGIYVVEINCDGVAEHSSTDHPNSAVHKLIQLLKPLLDTQFPETTFNIGKINGGVADNVVAGSAQATIAFRSARNKIDEQVKTVLDQANIPYRINVLAQIEPVDHTQPPFEKHGVSYFTEMAFLPNSIVLGPGSIKDAHTQNERVARRQLAEVVNIYLDNLSHRT